MSVIIAVVIAAGSSVPAVFPMTLFPENQHNRNRHNRDKQNEEADQEKAERAFSRFRGRYKDCCVTRIVSEPVMAE